MLFSTEYLDQIHLDVHFIAIYDNKNGTIYPQLASQFEMQSEVLDIIIYSYNQSKHPNFEGFIQNGADFIYSIEIEEEKLFICVAKNHKIQPGMLLSKVKSFIKAYKSQNEAREKHPVEDKQHKINAGVRTQQDILGSLEDLRAHFPHSFLIFQPKDSISGDFYWFKKIQKKYVLVLGDCTGHGMEGGLMTVMGVSLLKLLVNEQSINKPSLILEEIHQHILEMGNSSASVNTLGMELAICVFDEMNNELIFAGANINLYYLDPQHNIHIIKADRFVLGSVHHDTQVQNHKIENANSNTYFLFTDGVTDQVGAHDNKKLGKRAFLDTIHQLKELSDFEEKRKCLEKILDSWRKEIERTDDQTIISFKPVFV